MLSFSQRCITALLAATVGLLVCVCAHWGPRPLPPLTLSRVTVRFGGAAALDFARVIAEEFPDRVTGTAGGLQAGEYLRAQFHTLGYQVTTLAFSMWLHGKRVQGRNVIASLPGDSPEYVAVIAHYDSQFTSHQAAEDNASGVGVLLELASVLSQDHSQAALAPMLKKEDGQSRHHRGFIFAATDAEEWGMIGARELAPFLKEHHTVAVISLDYLTAGRATALEMSCSGQFAGYSPLWLRQLLVAAGRAQGVQFEQTTGAEEWIERALEISSQDQGPLLRAGIPAANLGTHPEDIEAVRARYHAPADTFRNFDPATFQMLGSTVEQALAALDALPLAGRQTSDSLFPASARTSGPTAWLHGQAEDFQISPSRFMPGWLIYIIQLFLILPILLAAFYAVHNFAIEDLDLRGWRFLEPASWIIPPGVATLLLYALTEVNVLPRYELYPATPKDPFLYHLPYVLLAALAAVIVAGTVGLQKLRVRVEAPRVSFAAKKRVLFIWVAIVAVAAFLDNAYAMWLFLGGFAAAALLLVAPRHPISRAVNAALLVISAFPFAALVCSFGRQIYLGWRIGWYLVLQAAYGVWSPLAVAIFLFTVVLGVQLFWIAVLEKNPA